MHAYLDKRSLATRESSPAKLFFLQSFYDEFLSGYVGIPHARWTLEPAQTTTSFDGFHQGVGRFIKIFMNDCEKSIRPYAECHLQPHPVYIFDADIADVQVAKEGIIGSSAVSRILQNLDAYMLKRNGLWDFDEQSQQWLLMLPLDEYIQTNE